ncbi:hypothetical protein DW322_18500 [Rhodococcus rhodnii]|uniref:GAF domain-containing protein n=2 Tax=Rhodococcus rhodnii TaxID=38312 RepID=R7WLI1_9NOCA|nr:hypothetical protein [Rhodococcus rhodnii]EOM76163.1 hypothetical protein Rrhod_2529 [Rhodococcus rhodnii LMG 5362]TXG91809.1 hypothetical protein DW322_18500 [Rhodococcus rhodnii]
MTTPTRRGPEEGDACLTVPLRAVGAGDAASTQATSTEDPLPEPDPLPQPDPFCERVARVAASTLGAPVAYVSIASERGDVLAGAVDREGSRPRHPAAIEGVVTVAEHELRTADGTVVGTLAVADRVERAWDDGDYLQLAELSELLVPQLDDGIAEAELTESAPSHDDMALLADAVLTLADHAETSNDPVLVRCGATAPRRLGSVLAAVPVRTSPRSDERVFDMRFAVGRALREAEFVTGRHVLARLAHGALMVHGDQFALERAVRHAVSSLLDHARSGPVSVGLEPDGAYARLSFACGNCTWSAAEVARIAADFDSAAGTACGPATLRVDARGVTAISPSLQVTTGGHGTSILVNRMLAGG